jgi:hypothetical protein
MRSYAIALLSLIACGSAPDIDTGAGLIAIAPDAGGCPYNVYQHTPGSWLLTQPFMVFDFWGAYWTEGNSFGPDFEAQNFQTQWVSLFDQGNVLQRLSEYGVHEGTISNNFYLNTGSTSYVGDAGEFVRNEDGGGVSMLDDTTFQPTINNEIQAGNLPFPTSNTIYVIMLPPNETTATMVNAGFIGYHDNGSYDNVPYTYAIILYLGNIEGNIVISHEVAEAATDPIVSVGGYFGANGEQEVGDLCENQTDTFVNVKVQKLWSAKLCQCQ